MCICHWYCILCCVLYCHIVDWITCSSVKEIMHWADTWIRIISTLKQNYINKYFCATVLHFMLPRALVKEQQYYSTANHKTVVPCH